VGGALGNRASGGGTRDSDESGRDRDNRRLDPHGPVRKDDRNPSPNNRRQGPRVRGLQIVSVVQSREVETN